MMRGQHQSLILLIYCCLVEAVKQSHFIHWNSSNPIFRIDNTDHIIDVNTGNKPWEFDQINIICPVYRPGQFHDEKDKEKSVIYSVTKDEYESCRITQQNPRVIAICNKPHELMYFTITFRSFSPTPGGMEFTPGKDYYFITTSSSDDLYQRVGGRCASHHMKVAFKVADNVQHQTTNQPLVNVPRMKLHPLYPPGTTSETDEHKDFMYRHQNPKKRPSSSSDDFAAAASSHPNDVIKHEASRLASTAVALKKTSSSAAAVLCAIIVLKLY